MINGDDILASLGHAVIVTDLAGVVLRWNAAAEDLYGWTAQEALGKSLEAITVPPSMRGYLATIVAEVQAHGSWSGAFTALCRDGSTFLAFVNDTVLRDDAGKPVGVAVAAFNLGEIVGPFLRRSHEAALVTDREGALILVSPAITALTGWRPEQLLGRSWWDLVHPDDRRAAHSRLQEAAATQELLPPVEQRLGKPDGTWVWVDASPTNLLEEPMVRGMLLTLRDVTERRNRVDELTRRALHDDLTGLVNRAVFMEHLETHVARRQHAGAVLYIDLDDFKAVNDQHGHEAGDLVLRTVAERLRESVRPEDVCGRLGGDEFAILSQEAGDEEQAEALGHRVSEQLAQPIQFADVTLHPSASVGVCVLRGTGDADGAIRLADEDMYVHKNAARRQAPPRTSIGP